MTAATGESTGVVKRGSRGTSSGLQSDQGLKLFGDACTAVTILQTIPSQSLRAHQSDLSYRYRLLTRSQ